MKNLKFFISGLVLSSISFWGINISAQALEDFFLDQFYLPQTTFLAEVPKDIFKKDLPPGYDILAKSALVLKLGNSGGQKVIFEKNSKESLAIASLTKLMTAVVSIENQPLSQEIEITPSMALQEGNSGTLKVGERIAVSELLKMILVESSNAAADALAEIEGRERFVQLMNFKAQELVLESTHFSTPTGLEAENNFSTVRDLANLMIFIVKNHPSLLEISSQPQVLIMTRNEKVHHRALNTNELLQSFPNLEGLTIVGGKTGYTDEAGGCIILLLKDKQENYYINVLLGAKDQESRFIEMKKLIEFFN